ncbi:hypothetical protein NQZ68_005618 [Dissostichus eleginoides]|nr:hypothetical protein NQZ68_005618 [Dissostichus eleginoides]
MCFFCTSDEKVQQFQGNDIPEYSEANCFFTNGGYKYSPLQPTVMQSQSLLYPQSNNLWQETAGWFPVENHMLERQTEAEAPTIMFNESECQSYLIADLWGLLPCKKHCDFWATRAIFCCRTPDNEVFLRLILSLLCISLWLILHQSEFNAPRGRGAGL